MMKILSCVLLVIIALFVPQAVCLQQVVHDDWDGLQVVFDPQPVTFGQTVLDGQPFTTVSIDGYFPSSAEGAPLLPTFSQLIEVSLCSGFEVTVSDAQYDTLQLSGYPLMPTQPSRSKSDTTPAKLVYNAKLYATDAFYGQEEVLVEPVGIARDRRLARLQFSPVRYNPVRGLLVICRHAVVTVRYTGADQSASINLFNRYHSPAFGIGGSILNSLYPKSVRTSAPIRYLIVAHSSFRGQLDDFVQWKRRKGYLTDIVYTDSSAVGTTTTSIAAYVRSQYTNATAACPAPTFLLLVGDHEQLPAFTGTTSSEHITDLYYISWTTGDNIPDCYCGRFSVQNVSQLTPQIEKTLMYEQYTFADPSFLDRAVLVAGVDGGSSGDYGYTHADPAMDYAATHYINASQGFSQVRYFKNNTSIVPSATGVTIGSSASSNSATVRNYYNQGAGWINYSAHGSATSWGTPNFTTTHINSMTNTQKFGLMIGNCCLTNKFETATCFGEALLRKNNYCGAVGYIGGSNSTYWYEDFYWAVGLRSSIGPTMSMAYSSANLGAYDRLCHTHGEPYSQWALTQASVMMVGNMAVESSTSSRKLYYWEIYHLMGDPSVMPYLTQAQPMTVSAPSVVVAGMPYITVTAAPYAYIALTDTVTHTLVVADYADSTGTVTLPLPTDMPVGGYELAASAQQYRTAFHPLQVVNPSGAYPVVASVRALQPLDAGDTVPMAITLVNLGDSSATNLTFSVTPTDSAALTLVPSTASVDNLPAGDTATFLWQAIVSRQVTDGSTVRLATATQSASLVAPNTAIYDLTLNAPAVDFRFAVTGGSILPGSTATLTAVLVNHGHAPLHSDRLMVTSPTRLLALPTAATYSSSLFTLAPGDSVSFSLPLHADSLLPQAIDVPLTASFQSWPSAPCQYPLYIGSLPIETFEGGTFHTSGWVQGPYPWTFASSGSYAGTYCLRSSASLTHNQTAQISFPLTLTQPDSVAFFYKVSSEANYDKFHVYLDNTSLITESGLVDWTRAVVPVPAGNHTLRFTYEKDYSVNRNSDCAWIDNVVLPRMAQPVVFRDDNLCVGDLYIVGADTVSTAVASNGAYVGSGTADTVLLVNYTIHPSTVSVDTVVACDSLVWNGTTYTASASDTLMSRSMYGCDSLFLLHLTVHQSYATADTAWACDTLLWRGVGFTATTDTAELFTATTGCDSILSHHLVVYHSVIDTITDSIVGGTYLWNDSAYTHPGTYMQRFATMQGCDSTVILVLTEGGSRPQSIDTLPTFPAVKVYPNPTTGRVVIDAARVLWVEVYDVEGRRMATFHGSSQLDLSSLPAGSYLLRIAQPGMIATKKLRVEN